MKREDSSRDADVNEISVPAGNEITVTEISLDFFSDGLLSEDEQRKAIDAKLDELNCQIEKVTCKANKTDYAIAIGTGILCGTMDAVLFSGASLKKDGKKNEMAGKIKEQAGKAENIEHGNEPDAGLKGIPKEWQEKIYEELPNILSTLKGMDGQPSPIGLAASILVQLEEIGCIKKQSKKLVLNFDTLNTRGKISIIVMSIVSGTLQWLIKLGGRNSVLESEVRIPGAIIELAKGIHSIPHIQTIPSAMNSWLKKSISENRGKKADTSIGNSDILLGTLSEIEKMPELKESGLDRALAEMKKQYQAKMKPDFLKAQTFPVLCNEIIVRIGYALSHLEAEYKNNHSAETIKWGDIFSAQNRTVDRMITVSFLAFNAVDLGVATYQFSRLNDAVEKIGKIQLDSEQIRCRVNYIGIARAGIAVVKEISYERKEQHLLYEKMLLMEEKTQLMISRLKQFETALEQTLSAYLVQDIRTFMQGFADMNEGIRTGDSDLIIKGNVRIQKALGRDAQFTTQKEFDDLMESENAFQF